MDWKAKLFASIICLTHEFWAPGFWRAQGPQGLQQRKGLRVNLRRQDAHPPRPYRPRGRTPKRLNEALLMNDLYEI